MPEAMMTVHLLGVDRFDAGVEALVLRLTEHTTTGMHEAGKAVVAAIHTHMDGRPGPRRITGTLFRSLRSEAIRSNQAVGLKGNAGGWARAIYPDGNVAPYARRIELGFVGADSRGRVYNQPPYPYFMPGLETAIADGAVRRTMANEWGKAIVA